MAEILCLHSAEASLVLEMDAKRGPVWRHLGARVEPGVLPSLRDIRGPASFALDDDVLLPLLPPSGLGWFGAAPVSVRDLERGHDIFLPDRFEIEGNSSSITVNSTDSVSGLRHRLEIGLLEGGAFRFTVKLMNEGDSPVEVGTLASVQAPLPSRSHSIVSWRGRHNAELVECREPMPDQRWERITRRGISGHGGLPGLYVLDESTGWQSGVAFALQLAWSGDSSLFIERDDEGFWNLGAAQVLAPGEVKLEPGTSFSAPDAILAVSTRGRNGAMAQQHSAVRDLIDWPGGAMKPRPVHLNSWEACYFDHDAERMVALARAGAAIGAERFVLDDGWFKKRRNDRAGLGDWIADPETYPEGLEPLAREINALGMEFGLWVEPEMINPDSDLYRTHPDWALELVNRERPTARNQLVIDMRRATARDHLFERLDAILSLTSIGYLKWDQNRDHAPSGGAAQTMGTYDLLRRIRKAHPSVEIEGCAGGGGRSDAGLAPYIHRFWTSDNIDAVARVAMQRGFAAFLPPEIMGSHIGASPAHATGRSQALPFRAAVACMGHLGVELDPATLSDADRGELARWIAFYKRWRNTLHGNEVHMGEGSDGLLWQAQGSASEKLLFAIRTSPAQDRRAQPLQLPFASTNEGWNVTLLEMAEQVGHGMPSAEIFTQMRLAPVRFSGSWLAAAGLPIPHQKAESVAIFLLEATS